MLATISAKLGTNFSSGQFFAITSESVDLGMGILERLFQAYSTNTHVSPYNALQSAVESVGNGMEIAACVLVGETLYSAAIGGAKVVINRGGSTGTIIQSGSGKVTAASGFPKLNDSMTLTTNDNGSSLTIKFEKEASSFKFDTSIFSRLIKKLPERKIYIHEPLEEASYSHNKKLTFTVSVILLLLLFVSIAFGIRQKKSKDVKAQYQAILVEAQNGIDQAISLASIDSERSRELFAISEQKLMEIVSLNVDDPKVEELKRKIEESRQGILGEYTGSPELFLNLTLITSGFNGEVIKSTSGNLYILDRTGKRIVSVEVDTKKSKVVAGPSVIDIADDLAAYEDRAFVLGGDGIYEVASSKNRVIDKDWGGAGYIQAFGGNMYAMDKSGNQIYRYQGQGSGFGTKQSWLSGSTVANFSDAKSWGIDGAVYVLYPNARILKYAQGTSQSFRLTGVIPEIGDLDGISADPDNQYLYLLDKSGQRIVVSDKRGTYKAQYRDPQIGEVVGLVASESSKKIILLTGDKLLALPMKHL